MQSYNPDIPRCTFKIGESSESSLEAAHLLSLADLAADFQCWGFIICHNNKNFNNTQSLSDVLYHSYFC